MIWFIVIILAAGLLMLAVMSASSKHHRQSKRTSTTLDRELVANRWQTITAQSQAGAAGLKTAVSEADKLLDYVMRGRGTAGDTMAERLKRTESALSNKEAVWQAHKLRNHLAHEVNFDLVVSQAQAAIQAYGQALRDLGALR